jgi:hypothetical protein
MLKNIEDTLNKSCLIGLSYFNVQGEQLNQNILAGHIVSVDSELGITVELSSSELPSNDLSSIDKGKGAHFILPSDLSCWFTAPKGEFHTSQSGVKIINPDYLVTWDIFQTKEQQTKLHKKSQNKSSPEKVQEGEQQWWQWRPRTQSPNVG